MREFLWEFFAQTNVNVNEVTIYSCDDDDHLWPFEKKKQEFSSIIFICKHQIGHRESIKIIYWEIIAHLKHPRSIENDWIVWGTFPAFLNHLLSINCRFLISEKWGLKKPRLMTRVVIANYCFVLKSNPILHRFISSWCLIEVSSSSCWNVAHENYLNEEFQSAHTAATIEKNYRYQL